jgi:hypothetical protein
MRPIKELQKLAFGQIVWISDLYHMLFDIIGIYIES